MEEDLSKVQVYEITTPEVCYEFSVDINGFWKFMKYLVEQLLELRPLMPSDAMPHEDSALWKALVSEYAKLSDMEFITG